MKLSFLRPVGAVGLLTCSLISQTPPGPRDYREKGAADASGPRVTSVRYLIRGTGGRVDWRPDSNEIAYDSLNAAGFSELHLMRSDGTGQRCLTCGLTNLTEHKGNPVWHPSGKLLLFQAADPALSHLARSAAQYRLVTGPGAGWHNNLWAMNADGSKTWKLTSVGNREGLIHAHFDATGKQLTWSHLERKFGANHWSMQVADFQWQDGTPRLTNVRSYRPGDQGFYETNDFSPDGSKILFTGKPQNSTPARFDYGVFEFDVATGGVRALTEAGDKNWNEHAHYTPDGKHIVWMTSRGIPQKSSYEGDTAQSGFATLRTEYWMMDRDGSHKTRLTYFNDPQSGMYVPERVIASDLSFHDNEEMVCYLGDNVTMSHPGSIAVLRLAY